MSKFSDFDCPECDGHGVTTCCCCDSESECEACEGTGYDPEKLDIAAWEAAEVNFAGRHGRAWDWSDPRSGKVLGRQAEGGFFLALADFAVVPGMERPEPLPGQLAFLD